MSFSSYRDRLTKWLNKEIKKFEPATIKEESEEHFGKPVYIEDKDVEQYLNLLNKILKYVIDNTREGKYEPLGYNNINRDLDTLKNQANILLQTKDWEKYIIIFFNGKSKEYCIMTTKYGSEIWRQKNPETGQRSPEGEKASEYWHKLKILIYEFNKTHIRKPNQKVEENQENNTDSSSFFYHFHK